MPAWLAPAIAASAAATSQGANAWAQGKMNRRTREFNEEMYNRQRIDNLNDWRMQNDYNLKMWHMQNDYNSPLAQMQRFQEAGLNPHLIYGQGQPGLAGGIASGDVKKSDVKPWSPTAPTFDFQSGVMAYLDAEAKTAQTDNIRAQNTVLHQEALNKAVDTDIKLNVKAQGDFDLGLKNQLRDNTIALAQESLRAEKTKTDIAISAEERAKAAHAKSMDHLTQQIVESRARVQNLNVSNRQIEAAIKNMGIDSQLKQADLELRKAGMSYSDSLPLRLGLKAANKILDYLKGRKPNTPFNPEQHEEATLRYLDSQY